MMHFDEGITSISKGLGDAAKGVAPYLTGVDVQDESLTGADIDNGSLKGADIADEAIRSTDVRDGSLKITDLRPSAGAALTPQFVVRTAQGNRGDVLRGSASFAATFRPRFSPTASPTASGPPPEPPRGSSDHTCPRSP